MRQVHRARYVLIGIRCRGAAIDTTTAGMKRYLVELEAEEREVLAAIMRKGSHRSQKVVNALVLLNCDQGEFNERRTTGREIAGVLRISARRVDRVKKRFVEDGLEAALGNRQGRRAKYLRKADGEFEARLVALSCGDPPEGRAKWSPNPRHSRANGSVRWSTSATR